MNSSFITSRPVLSIENKEIYKDTVVLHFNFCFIQGNTSRVM